MFRSMARTVVVGSMGLLACSAGAPTSEVAGACADAYGADVCTWAIMQAGQVVSVGATVPLASIEGAPDEAPMTWPPTMAAAVDLPPGVSASTGLTHMTVYWEPMGHTPATFMTPHFDFHFYLVPSSRRRSIDCADVSKPSAVPAGYVVPDEVLPPELVELTGLETLIGLCVPEMGMHSVNMVEAESEELFAGTMIVGYYEGEPVFMEPMISRALLLERNSFDLTVPAVPGLDRGPTTFRAAYDSGLDAYRFELSGFTRAD